MAKGQKVRGLALYYRTPHTGWPYWLDVKLAKKAGSHPKTRCLSDRLKPRS